jgi:PhzF family phenazine biosynthesis protein
VNFLLSNLTFNLLHLLIKIFQVDAFTKEAFKGNPAAVCLLEDNADVDEHWMQSIAQEFNISDTAFLIPVISAIGSDDQDASSNIPRFNLRWFTPVAEVFLSDSFIKNSF